MNFYFVSVLHPTMEEGDFFWLLEVLSKFGPNLVHEN